MDEEQKGVKQNLANNTVVAKWEDSTEPNHTRLDVQRVMVEELESLKDVRGNYQYRDRCHKRFQSILCL